MSSARDIPIRYQAPWASSSSSATVRSPEAFCIDGLRIEGSLRRQDISTFLATAVYTSWCSSTDAQ